MDTAQFEQEKSILNIEGTLDNVLEFVEKGDFQNAFKILKPVVDNFEKGIKIENTENEEYFSFADNIEFFTKLIENAHNEKTTNIMTLNPSYSRMYHLLGYLYVELGNNELAINALLNSLKLNPVSAGTFLELAEIYKKNKAWNDYLPIAMYGLKYAKNTKTLARAYRGLGYYYCEQKKLELAVALYMHSLQFEDNQKVVGNEVAYIYELSGKSIELPSPDKAVSIIIENNIEIDVSNYVFAGYTKFLQALKDAGEKDAYNYYFETLKTMIVNPEKSDYLEKMNA